MEKDWFAIAKKEALKAHTAGRSCFLVRGVEFLIRHAHDSEYQVLLPDESEIFRIIDGSDKKIFSV